MRASHRSSQRSVNRFYVEGCASCGGEPPSLLEPASLEVRLRRILTPPTHADAMADMNTIHPSATKSAGQRHGGISAKTEYVLLQAAGADEVNAMAKSHAASAASPSTPARTNGIATLLLRATAMNSPLDR